MALFKFACYKEGAMSGSYEEIKLAASAAAE